MCQYVQCGTNLDGMKLIFDQAPSDCQQLHIVFSFGVGLGVSEPTFHTNQLMAKLWGGLTDIIDTLVTDFNWGCCFNHHSLRVCKVKRSIASGIHNRLEPYFWMSAEVGMSVNTLYTNKKLSSNWNDYPTQKNSFRQMPTHGTHSYYSNYVYLYYMSSIIALWWRRRWLQNCGIILDIYCFSSIIAIMTFGISDGRRRGVLHTCFQHILLKAKRHIPWYSKQRKTDVLLHGRRSVLDTCFQRVLLIQRGKYPNIRRKIKTHISHKVKYHIILISQLAYYISERSIHVHQHLNLFQTTIQFTHHARTKIIISFRLFQICFYQKAKFVELNAVKVYYCKKGA